MKDIIKRTRWEENYPPSFPRTRIIKYLSMHGPDYNFSISKALYRESTPSRGYSTVNQNVRQLVAEGVLTKVGEEPGEKGRPKTIYSLTEISGVIAAIAFVGLDLKFKTMVDVHKKVWKNFEAVETFRATWEEGGRRFATRVCRKAYLASMEGEDAYDEEEGHSKRTLLDHFVLLLEDDEVPLEKLKKIVRRSKPMQKILLEVYDQISQLLKAAKIDPKASIDAKRLVMEKS